MSRYMPRQEKYEPQGIIFGEAQTMHNEKISVLVRGPESVAFQILINMFRATLLLRLKPSQLVKLRDALNKAIEWHEERNRE